MTNNNDVICNYDVIIYTSEVSERLGLHGQQVEDFLREGKEMARCDHPRVVKFLAVCTL